MKTKIYGWGSKDCAVPEIFTLRDRSLEVFFKVSKEQGEKVYKADRAGYCFYGFSLTKGDIVGFPDSMINLITPLYPEGGTLGFTPFPPGSGYLLQTMIEEDSQ